MWSDSSTASFIASPGKKIHRIAWQSSGLRSTEHSNASAKCWSKKKLMRSLYDLYTTGQWLLVEKNNPSHLSHILFALTNSRHSRTLFSPQLVLIAKPGKEGVERWWLLGSGSSPPQSDEMARGLDGGHGIWEIWALSNMTKWYKMIQHGRF